MPGGGVFTGPPDFIGVGTQRSGTTWWQRLLKRHPTIKAPANRKKEQHFFDQFGRRPMDPSDIARYHELFPRRPGELSGEWTPRYMRDFWGPRALAQAAPGAKLLVMFRDPVERYRSGILHTEEFLPRHSAQWRANDAIERGRYATQLRRVYDYFDRDQVLILQYEQCKADPFEQYRRTLEFIGAPQHAPKEPKRTRGSYTTPRKEPIWDDLRYAIVRELEEEVAALDEMVPDLDLNLWENFRHLRRLGNEPGGRHEPATPEPPARRATGSVPALRRVANDTGRSDTTPTNDTGPPDYVGVGTANAGWDWWHQLLLEHDSIAAPPKKRLDFFDTFCTRAMTGDDIASYHAEFQRRGGELVGEWAPDYIYQAWTPMLLHKAAPQAKLLVMLMNPVDRYAAVLAATARKGRKETHSLSNTLSRGRYAQQLRGLLEHYDREQILVLQLERCLAEPAEQYARTLRFLDVADDCTPAGLGRRQMRRTRRRFERADVDLWPDLEVPMLKELDADVRELRELVPDLDLSLWPEFAGPAHG